MSPFHQDASLPSLLWFQVLKSKIKEKERRNSKPYQFSPALLQQSLPSSSSWRNSSKANLLVSLSIHGRRGVMPPRCSFMEELASLALGVWSRDSLCSQPLRSHLSGRVAFPHASIHPPTQATPFAWGPTPSAEWSGEIKAWQFLCEAELLWRTILARELHTELAEALLNLHLSLTSPSSHLCFFSLPSLHQYWSFINILHPKLCLSTCF